jgi:hypothetical protein
MHQASRLARFNARSLFPETVISVQRIAVSQVPENHCGVCGVRPPFHLPKSARRPTRRRLSVTIRKLLGACLDLCF